MISCVVCAFLWLFSFTALQAPSALSGAVEDETKQPVPGVQVTLHSGAAIQLTSTNEAGRFRFDSLPAGDYSLDFDKAGFFRLTNYAVTIGTPSTEITVTMNHEYEIRSQVDVVSTPHEIVPEQTRHEEELVAHEIRENPVPSSHNLQNALPATPGVVVPLPLVLCLECRRRKTVSVSWLPVGCPAVRDQRHGPQ